MKIDIQTVKTKKELRDFVMFPWQIYKNDPFWVPPLIGDQLKFLNKNKGVFFEFGTAEYFLAFSDGKPVGRLSVHIDYQFEKYQDSDGGKFGFFECINDQQVADALFKAAENWLKNKNKKRVYGPYNFTLYDASGMLCKGFDSMPVVLLTYNPPYYNELLSNAGYKKSIDWYAFMVNASVNLPSSFSKIRDRVLRQGIRIETLDLKELPKAVKHIAKIFNTAWDDNWGHVPLTDRQIDELANELKYIVEPSLTYLAFIEDQCIGFSLSVKDANPALKKANGRLYPFGLIKIMRGMKSISRLRTVAMGVLQEYRKKGLDILFYLNTVENGIKMGYTESECSIIVETNHRMIGALKDLQANNYKTYRFYEKEI